MMKDLQNDINSIYTSKLYSSLGDMLADNIPYVERILYGTGRCQVGMLVSVTDIGKTTLMLNTLLALASGESFLPLAPEVKRPYRILYCDFESTKSELKEYLLTMLKALPNRRVAEKNFIPLVDHEIDDQPLALSNPEHLRFLAEYARGLEVDLIVIDPVTAAFELADENSNAEVTRAVIKPLKRLARDTNTLVWFSHHSGKPSESPMAELAYWGRGASSFGGLSRAVFVLSRQRTKGSDYVLLQCAKVKGRRFEPVLLKLNREIAKFEVCAEEAITLQSITVDDIVAFIDNREEVKRNDITAHFKDRISPKTVDRLLETAVKLGRIDGMNP